LDFTKQANAGFLVLFIFTNFFHKFLVKARRSLPIPENKKFLKKD